MKQINFFLEGESSTLMTVIDSTNDQNIVTIEIAFLLIGFFHE